MRFFRRIEDRSLIPRQHDDAVNRTPAKAQLCPACSRYSGTGNYVFGFTRAGNPNLMASLKDIAAIAPGAASEIRERFLLGSGLPGLLTDLKQRQSRLADRSISGASAMLSRPRIRRFAISDRKASIFRTAAVPPHLDR